MINLHALKCVAMVCVHLRSVKGELQQVTDMNQAPLPLPLTREPRALLTRLFFLSPALYFALPLLLLHSELPSALRVMSSARCLDALWVTLSTSLTSTALMLLLLTPLAWQLSGGPAGVQSAVMRRIEGLCLIPLALPPTVSGVALLLTFGRGRLGEWSWAMSTAAVVGAQLFIAGPLYLRGASHAFASVPSALREVGLSLGAPSRDLFWRLALPLSAPALLSAALTAWLRALGEFGATLLFAGNLQGSTQTMPLAIYSLLELDQGMAIGLSLWLLWGAGLLSVALLTQTEVSHNI